MSHIVQLDLFLLVSNHETSSVETELGKIKSGGENVMMILLLSVKCLGALLIALVYGVARLRYLGLVGLCVGSTKVFVQHGAISGFRITCGIRTLLIMEHS